MHELIPVLGTETPLNIRSTGFCFLPPCMGRFRISSFRKQGRMPGSQSPWSDRRTPGSSVRHRPICSAPPLPFHPRTKNGLPAKKRRQTVAATAKCHKRNVRSRDTTRIGVISPRRHARQECHQERIAPATAAFWKAPPGQKPVNPYTGTSPSGGYPSRRSRCRA